MAGGIKRYFQPASARNDAHPAGQDEPPKKRVKDDFDDEIDLTKDEPEEVVDLTKASTSEPGTSKQQSSHQKTKAPHETKPKRDVKKETADASKLSAADILSEIPSVKLPDVDPHQKVNLHQILQNRKETGDAAAGPEPEAAPDCLSGLTFVVTGTLPTLGRDQVTSLIKRLGGNVTSSLSGRTSCVILGDDAGPSKIAKTRQLGLKAIDEAGFRQLLAKMPAGGGSGDAARKAHEKQALELQRAEKKAKEFTSLKTETPNQLWTDKYAPHSLSDMVGNQTVVKRLQTWLTNWPRYRKAGFKAGLGEGSDYRAAILHGAPGIGKTTAAHLVGNMCGYDVLEYNASDTRSKSLLQQHVSQTLSNTTLGQKSEKQCIIMDEVDGMSAGDRGGVGAMAQLARTTNVPLILICNERTIPKMRPFDRITFDLPFRRPDAASIRPRVMAIAAAEGLKLEPSAIEQLCQTTRSDMRQILNLLSTYATTVKQMSFDTSRSFGKSWNKEVVLKPFDIVSRYLSSGYWRQGTLNDRIELYFNDYDFAPLMIQENYLQTAPAAGRHLQQVCNAADSISEADLVDRKIHGPQQMWSLMPLHALYSCVYPSSLVAGQARGRFGFTSFLGQNSKAGKYRRLLAEVRSHMRLKLAANAQDLRLEYQPELVERLLSPLLKRGQDGIPEIIEFMDNYYLTREDWDVFMELGVGTNSSEMKAKKVPTAVKTAFTRKYNAQAHPLPFMKSTEAKSAAKRAPPPDLDEVVDDDMEAEPEQPSEPSLEERLASDKYIKRPKAKSSGKSAGTKQPAKRRSKK